jgi:tryptophanyl-tRNA synthetase
VSNHSSPHDVEYRSKITIKEKIETYYQEQTNKNGLQNLRLIMRYLPEECSDFHFTRSLVFSHLDFEFILEKVAKGEEFAVVSGLNPSSPLHLGHKALFDVLLFLQKLGGRIFIPLTNDESVLDGKLPTLAESRKMAHEHILPDLAAFGFDPQRTHMYVLSDYPEIYNFAMHLNRHVSLASVKTTFGEDSLSSPGQIFYRSLVQMAQILLPQLPEFGGPQPTLIPVGVDQHPYLLLARDVAKKLKMIPPSELVLKFQPSLRDPEAKMSGSKPETAIYLTDNAQTIERKINRAYTGALSSLESHQKYGGIPEICSVFSLLNFHHPDEDVVSDIKSKYEKGEIKMDELKKCTSDYIVGLTQEHQKKRALITEQEISKYLLTKKLSSFL